MPVNLEIVSPERLLLARPVEMVVIPASEGDMGVLEGHAPAIVMLRGGIIALYEDDRITDQMYVAGGFAEVTPERCTVLADEAMPFEEVTPDQLAERERAAEREITDAGNDAEKAAAEKALAVAKDLRRAQAYYASR